MRLPSARFCSVTLLSAIFFLFTVLFSGCSSKERFEETTSLEEFQKASAEQEDDRNIKNSYSEMPLLSSSAARGEYLLGPGDLLSVTVYEDASLNTETRVSSRGNINLPLLNDVDVFNLTPAEAEQKVENLYRENYLQDPHVAVFIKEHVSKQITLVGALKHPGTYEYVSQRRLLDVLAIGEGLTPNAGTLAFITRTDSRTGKTTNYMVDLDDLVRNGNMALNHVILGGDILFVPESGQCFVDGAVRKPGTYPLKGKMTITEAVTMAGGLAGWADEDKIKLVRFMGEGEKRQVVSLSYSDLQAGKGDSLFLKNQDIVFAESSASGKFFSGSGLSLGFMGTGITFKNPEK